MSYTSRTPLTVADAPTLDVLGSLLGDLVRPLFRDWRTGSRFGPSTVTASRLADDIRFIFVYGSETKWEWIHDGVIPVLDVTQQHTLRATIETFCDVATDKVAKWQAETRGDIRLELRAAAPALVRDRGEYLKTLFL